MSKMQPGSIEPNVFNRVWGIYDDYRTALFNELYFEEKLASNQLRTKALDIFVAVGTSTTGLAGWALWNNPGFATVWAGLAGTAATAAIVKPILGWHQDGVKFGKIYGHYCQLRAEYALIEKDLAYKMKLDDDIMRRSTALAKKEAAIERVPQGSRKSADRVQSEVNRRLPMDRFWSPPKPDGGNHAAVLAAPPVKVAE